MEGLLICWVNAPESKQQHQTLKEYPQAVRHIGVYGYDLVTNLGRFPLAFQQLVLDPIGKYNSCEEANGDIGLMELEGIDYSSHYDSFGFKFRF